MGKEKEQNGEKVGVRWDKKKVGFSELAIGTQTDDHAASRIDGYMIDG